MPPQTVVSERPAGGHLHIDSGLARCKRAVRIIYAFSLTVAISVWFIAIRAPLRQDETGTWWEICAGLSKIWPRHQHAFPAYLYILWLSTKIFGTSEMALRIPSVLAMLGAVWLLYLAARELFSRELALITAILFCLHPIVIFESIDIRTYVFAVLATTAATYVLLRLRRSDSIWPAALFGLLAAVIVSFHYLFALILPAFVACFFLIKTGNRKIMWRQFGVAAIVLLVACLPVIPGLLSLFHRRGILVYTPAPGLGTLIGVFASGMLAFVFCGVVLVAAVEASFRPAREDSQQQSQPWRILVSASLAFIPILILFGISTATPIHMFLPRYCLVSVPGIAFCWALLIERYLKTQFSRLLLCVVLVAATAFFVARSPFIRDHSFTRKYALQAAEKNASVDNAPVLVCSGFVESHYLPMPIHSAKTSWLFAPLSYYKLTVPVVPMPWGLNDEAKRVGSQFLTQATQKHQRFLAVASDPSYETLDWLSKQASSNYSVRDLGTFDTVKVWEFDPRAAATPPAGRSSDQRPRPFVKEASRPAMR